MIIDTSSIFSILLGEANAMRYENPIAGARPRLMSTIARLKTAKVVDARGGAKAGQALDTDPEEASVELVEITAEQAAAARRACRRFRKGNHPAALRFGDCVAYALSEITDAPLLFKGSGFARTDVTVALPPLKGEST